MCVGGGGVGGYRLVSHPGEHVLLACFHVLLACFHVLLACFLFRILFFTHHPTSSALLVKQDSVHFPYVVLS